MPTIRLTCDSMSWIIQIRNLWSEISTWWSGDLIYLIRPIPYPPLLAIQGEVGAVGDGNQIIIYKFRFPHRYRSYHTGVHKKERAEWFIKWSHPCAIAHTGSPRRGRHSWRRLGPPPRHGVGYQNIENLDISKYRKFDVSNIATSSFRYFSRAVGVRAEE